MRVINIQAVKQKQEEAKKTPAIVVVRKAIPKDKQPATSSQQPEAKERTRPQLLAHLDEQVLEIRRDRNKVSNRARIRWQAGADETELAQLYETINAFTAELQKLWDKRQHVEKFGTLPEETKDVSSKTQESADVAVMKLEKKKLEEKKSKLRAKLKPNAKSPYNSARKLLWQAELDRTDAMWMDLNEKIKKLSYEARK